MAGIRKKTVRHQWKGGNRERKIQNSKCKRQTRPAGLVSVDAATPSTLTSPSTFCLHLEFCILHYLFYFPAAAADGGIVARGRRGVSPSTVAATAAGCGDACAATAASMKRPKIILPAVVCSTLVTTTSIVLPIM